MLIRLIVPLIILLAVVVYFLGSPLGGLLGTEAGPEVIVEMKEDGYTPGDLTIKKNTKVVFKNLATVARWPASNLHPTHGIYPEFDPQNDVSPQGEWSFVFDKVGEWRYHDHLDPRIKGTIKVEN